MGDGPVRHGVPSTTTLSNRLALSAAQGQAAKILQSALGLLTGLILARVLGPAGVGIYASAIAISVLVQVGTSFGLEDLVLNRVPGLFSSGRDEQANNVVRTAGRVRTVIASLMIVGATITILAGRGGSEGTNLTLAIIGLAVMYAALSSLATLGAAVRAAHFEALRPALLDTGWSFLMLVGVGLMAVNGALTPFRVVVLTVATEATVVIGYFLLVGRDIARPGVTLRPFPHRAATTFWANGVLAFGIGKSTDLLLIRLSGQPFSAVGRYNAAFSLFSLAGVLLIAAVMTFSQVGLASAIGQGDQARIERAWRRAVTLIALVSFPALGFLVVQARVSLVALYGDAFEGATTAVVILALTGLVIRALGGGASQGVLYAKDRQGTSLRIRLGTVTLNVIGDLVLVRLWGIAGVAMATGGCGVLAIILEYRAARRVVRLPHPSRTVAVLGCGTALACAVVYPAPGWPGSALLTLLVHGVLFGVTFYLFQLAVKPLDDHDLVMSLPGPLGVALRPLSKHPELLAAP